MKSDEGYYCPACHLQLPDDAAELDVCPFCGCDLLENPPVPGSILFGPDSETAEGESNEP